MTTFFSRLTAVIAMVSVCLAPACASSRVAGKGPADARQKVERGYESAAGAPRIAVLPVYNMTGAPFPAGRLEALLYDSLSGQDVPVVQREELERFMARRRMRFTGGINDANSLAMKEEGIDGILITTLELFDEHAPPKIALHARLVSSGARPRIQWTQSICMAGDDAPGFLDLHVIEDPHRLMETAVNRLTGSLLRYLAGNGQTMYEVKSGGSIRPRDEYRSTNLVFENEPTIAVIPFQNLSDRPLASQIVALHFVEEMAGIPGIRVLEPGVVRQAMLDSRVQLEGGLSLPHLELILRSTPADFVLTGKVSRYVDAVSPSQDPKVEFSIQILDRESRKVVWSSSSQGKGSDGIVLFGVGRRSTACRLAEDLVRGTVSRFPVLLDGKGAEGVKEGAGP